MSTIYILWLRQVKKYFRARSRIVGALGQPLLFMLAFGFGFGQVFRQAGQGDYIQFLGPGIIMMSVLFAAVFSGIDLIWDRQFGFLKETMIAPVPRWQIMLGKTLGGATVASFQGLIVFLMALVIGFRFHDPLMLPLGALFVFLVAVIFTSFGVAIASRIEDMQGFQLIMNFLVMPLFFLSGALFPLQGLPAAMEVVTRVNPVSYGVDGLRGALIDSSVFGIATDLLVMVVLAVVLLAIGSYLFEKIQA
ncbi:MAG: multidrug ABC transporter permease [Dehalococcoidia bacterium]|nr:MAG: multidrug ABC transporter permease [Dehalococcoidia bacterium]